MFWKRFLLWFVPANKKQCHGCCIYCRHFDSCYNELYCDLFGEYV